MTTYSWNRWIRSSRPSLLPAGLAFLFLTVAAPGISNAALFPACAPQATPGTEGPEPTRASVTLVVDGMMKSRSGAT